MQELSLVNRWAAAQIHKFGLPIPTSVNADVLGQARSLSEGGAGTIGELPSLVLGGIATGKVSWLNRIVFTMFLLV